MLKQGNGAHARPPPAAALPHPLAPLPPSISPPPAQVMLKQDNGVYACIAEDAVRYNLGEVRAAGLGGIARLCGRGAGRGL
jgi:hypothetical protein